MKSDTENITDMFYVDNNKCLTNEAEKKGSWCCNVATCSRGPSGERVSKVAKLSTETNFGDLKHAYETGEKPVPVRRKLPGKPKGLKVSRKIRRTFTLCCAQGQTVSSDDDNEADSYEREHEEDEQSPPRADVKNVTEERNWYAKKTETESFWKSLLPSPVFDTKDEEQDACSTPVNILQVYAADANLHISPHYYDPGLNNVGYPVGRNANGDLQGLDSDDDSTSYDISTSSDDSFSSGDGCSFFENEIGSSRSSLEISLEQRDGLMFEYDSDEDKNEVTLNTELSRNETDIQPTAVEPVFEEKLERKAFETPSSQASGDLANFSNKTDSSVSFNLSLVAREVESNVPSANDNAKPLNAYQDISELLDNDEDDDNSIEQVLALVNDMVNSGRIGFKRNVDEPDDDDECFMIDIKHSRSGLPYDQVKRLTCRISELINDKHVQFVHSNNPDSSPWFTVSSYSGDKLVLRQENATAQPNNDEQTGTECKTDSAQTISKCKKENMEIASENNSTDDKISNQSLSETLIQEPLRSICDGKFSSVLDDLRKCSVKESATDFVEPVELVEELPKGEEKCHLHISSSFNIDEERFVQNDKGNALISENGCAATHDKDTNDSSDEMVSVQLNELTIDDEHDHMDKKLPSIMQMVIEGIKHGIRETIPGTKIGKEIIASLETYAKKERIENQPGAGGIEKNETGNDLNWITTDQPPSLPAIMNVSEHHLKLSDCNKPHASSLTKIQAKNNEAKNDEQRSNFTFAESSLTKQYEGIWNEKLLSKQLDTDMEDSSRSTCMNSKPVPLTLADAPGCVKAKEPRQKLRERHTMNRLVTPTDNFPVYTRNQSYHVSRTFATNGATKGVSGPTLLAAQLSKAEKDPSKTTSAYGETTEQCNRIIKTARRRLKTVPKVEGDELTTVQAEKEVPLSSVPIRSEASPSTVSLQSKAATKTASEQFKSSPSKAKVARSSAPVRSTTASAVSSTIPIQSKSAASTASEKSKARSTKTSKELKTGLKNVPEISEVTPTKASEQTDLTPSKVKSKATRSKSKLKNETPSKYDPVQPDIDQTADKVQQDTAPSTVSEQTEVGELQQTQKVDHVQAINFIDTDVDVTTPKVEEAPPVYLETDATIDYGRCVVEPGHGERPDKKKLRAEIKEKVKTKGKANKHLKAEKENNFPMYDEIDVYFQDESYDLDDSVNFENSLREEEEEGARAASPVVLNAVDQPQVLDDREIKMVPETIKRVDDPYLADVEEEYRVSSGCSNKREKRKQKDARKKEKRAKKTSNTIIFLS